MTDTAGYLRTLARAKAQTDSERWAEAAGLWEQVVAANPVNGNHWDRLAQARFESHDYAGALVAYEKVRDLGVWDQRETVFPSAVWYRIACCHARLGDAEEALRALGRAVELGVRDLGVWDQRETVFPSAVWYRIACCHARLGDAEEALRALGRAVELGLRDL